MTYLRPAMEAGRTRRCRADTRPGNWTGHRSGTLRSDRPEHEPDMRTVTPCPFGRIELLFTRTTSGTATGRIIGSLSPFAANTGICRQLSRCSRPNRQTVGR